jgi:hypothetical protein
VGAADAGADADRDVAVPEEGTVLPDSYSYRRGESRAAVLKRMQDAMAKELDALWAKRKPTSVVNDKRQAIILASVVEKETGKPSERRMVAGVYSNRLRQGIKLDADPTVIYPITKGKPLGRRIRRSELQANNGYNTYAMAGLPAGPIANPGRESIAAVLDPAPTQALYFVADGTGGHVFANTLAEHNANVRSGMPSAASAGRCRPKLLKAAPADHRVAGMHVGQRLHHDGARVGGGMDQFRFVRHEADVAVEEDEIAPLQRSAVVQCRPKHPLLIAVARRRDAAKGEGDLHQPRTIDAPRGAPAEQVGSTEQSFRHANGIALDRIERADLGEGKIANVREQEA